MSEGNFHFQAVGSGPPVLCLHSSTSSSKQWNSLAERLSDRFTVIAVDLYGYGKSPHWKEERMLTLNDEVALIEPALAPYDEPAHLVGHSYGGAVAMAFALLHSEKVASLVVYEPVLFQLLYGEAPCSAEAREIWDIQTRVRKNIERDDPIRAAEKFVNYWTGGDNWGGLPDWQKRAIAERMTKVPSDFDAAIYSPQSLYDIAGFSKPTLLLYGLDSPASTQKITWLLGKTLPQAEVRGLLNLGHMAPMTHPDWVNRMIERFLSAQMNNGACSAAD